MTEGDENSQYSPDNPKSISRARLERIREQLLAPTRTTPPTIGTYSRAIDVELFQIFYSNPVVQTALSETVLAGQVIARERQVWAYQVKSTFTEDYDEQGGVHRVEVKFDPPHHYEVPRYTSVVDDALALSQSLLSFAKRVRIEEVPQEDELPLWKADILDEQDQIEGSGETYDAAASIILAIISDLLTNKSASWRVTATDD